MIKTHFFICFSLQNKTLFGSWATREWNLSNPVKRHMTLKDFGKSTVLFGSWATNEFNLLISLHYVGFELPTKTPRINFLHIFSKHFTKNAFSDFTNVQQKHDVTNRIFSHMFWQWQKGTEFLDDSQEETIFLILCKEKKYSLLWNDAEDCLPVHPSVKPMPQVQKISGNHKGINVRKINIS